MIFNQPAISSAQPARSSKSDVQAGASVFNAKASPSNDSVRFSGGLPAVAARQARPLGLGKSIKMLWQHMRQAENRDVIKGLTYQYGPDAALPLMFAMPFGVALGALAWLPSQMLSKRGEKLIEKLKQEGKLEEGKGPLYRIANMRAIWQTREESAPDKTVNEAKRLLDELFPDDGTGVGAARERIKETVDKRLPGLLRRAQTLSNHAYNAQRHYADKWQGRLMKSIKWTGGKIPFRPLRLPLIVAGYGLQGLMMLFGHKAIKQAAAQAKTVAPKP